MAKPENYWAVVPAAGAGSRMQQSTPKQYLILHGLTILEHSLAVLLAHDSLRRVVVCVAPSDKVWESLNVSSDSRVAWCAGGQTRAQSVLNGLIELADLAQDNDWVLVHDAARPCLGVATLNKLIDELSDHAIGGLLALPAQDTLKRASADNMPHVAETLDRSTIWHAQTPQMFRFGLLRSALENALEKNLEITDEASALEKAGYAPCLVAGDARNIKITNSEDLALAEFLLASKTSTINAE